jgi:uncharacterized protein YndB with AHSA1/START domain
MNIVLTIVAVVAILLALILILATFISREYVIHRDILVRAPREEVFDFIRYLRNQELYSKWVMIDPDMARTFRGIDGTPGFVYAWEGDDKAGKGEQEIMAIRENEGIDIEVRFERPFKGIAAVNMTTSDASRGHTRVSWSMSGRNPYPLNALHLLFRGALGKDMETSLQNLRGILEKQPAGG